MNITLAFYRTQVQSCIALPSPWVSHLILVLNFDYIVGFVKVDTWISLGCYMDFSKMLHVFLYIVTWICQNRYMHIYRLLYGFVKIDKWIILSCYMDLSKLLHGFVKDVTWIGQSCCCCCISCPLPNKTKSKFDQYFKACWSFLLILRQCCL